MTGRRSRSNKRTSPQRNRVVNKRTMQALAALLVAVVGVGSRAGGGSKSSSPIESSASVSASASGSSGGQGEVDRSIGFKSAAQLNSHFAKHGREFGSITKAQYLAMAQDLRDAPLSSSVIEAWQARGNWSRFDRRSGSFIAFRRDKVILTFFRPDDGEAYFKRASKSDGTGNP